MREFRLVCHGIHLYHPLPAKEMRHMVEHTAELLGARNDRRIVFLVMDGLGDLPGTSRPETPLEAARKPNINALLPHSTTGLFDPVEPGITPGSRKLPIS